LKTQYRPILRFRTIRLLRGKIGQKVVQTGIRGDGEHHALGGLALVRVEKISMLRLVIPVPEKYAAGMNSRRRLAS
jgi:hypothetical protein